MEERVVLIFMIYLLKSIGAFDINKTPLTVSTRGSEITVTVPDESDLKSVFISTELSDQCTAGFTFVNNLNNSGALVYKQDVNKELKPNDVVQLLSVFETKDQVIRKAFSYRIDSQGNGIQQVIAQKAHGDECECIPTPTVIDQMRQSCSGKLIFKEDFEGDMSKWEHEKRTLWYGNKRSKEFVVYTNENDTLVLKDGHLVLNAKWVRKNPRIFELKDCTSRRNANDNRRKECGPLWGTIDPLPSINSAKVYSAPFQFKYGRVEIRARFAKGDWLLSYLMLQDVENVNTDLNSHIRIYARGNWKMHDKYTNSIGPETVFGSAILMGPIETIEYRNAFGRQDSRILFEEFHNHTIIWREDKIIFKIDGITYGTITDEIALRELNMKERTISLGLTAWGAMNFPDDYILPAHKTLKNGDTKEAAQFLDLMDKAITTWEKPSLEIDSVHVYSIHANEE
ncbi:hypothetical protein KR044_007180 [Drosophila immigrans]|nr:hypothetical protein KR044_007180 [Drosophila immigrans]